MLSKEVTVTFPRDQYNAVCNLVQLVAVLGIRLHANGPQPNVPLLKEAFTTLARAGIPTIGLPADEGQ